MERLSSRWAPPLALSSSRLPHVLMMQTSDQRHLDHLPTIQRLHRPWNRTVVIEGSMGADFEAEVQSTIPHNTRCRKFAIRGTTSTVNRSSSEGDTIVLAARSVSVISQAKGCRIVLKCRHGCWIEPIVYDLGGKPNQRWIGKRWSGFSNF